MFQTLATGGWAMYGSNSHPILTINIQDTFQDCLAGLGGLGSNLLQQFCKLHCFAMVVILLFSVEKFLFSLIS